MNKHVVISAPFWQQPNTGSGQYLRGLLAHLPAALPGWRISLLLPRFLWNAESDQALAVLPAGLHALPVATPFDQRSNALAKLWYEQIAVPQAAQRLRANVLHVPYFAPPLYTPMPTVVSILDLIPLLLPEYRGGRSVQVYMRLVARAAHNATHVLTLSQASKRDIVSKLGIPEARITVTYLAAGTQYGIQDKASAQTEVAARYGINEPFLYYVGGLDARKNVATLVRAYASMRRAGGPAMPLVIAGRALGHDPLLFPDLDAVIAAEQAQGWIRRIEVPPEDSALLYSAAEVFAFPSRYEGFGLGPLEAMACGTPVLTSTSSSLPEVVADAALTAAPDDLVAWQAQLNHVLSDAALRARLRQRGVARAAQFSYGITAAQTAAVYQKLVNDH